MQKLSFSYSLVRNFAPSKILVFCLYTERIPLNWVRSLSVEPEENMGYPCIQLAALLGAALRSPDAAGSRELPARFNSDTVLANVSVPFLHFPDPPGISTSTKQLRL
jgi:hypothetical protein